MDGTAEEHLRIGALEDAGDAGAPLELLLDDRPDGLMIILTRELHLLFGLIFGLSTEKMDSAFDQLEPAIAALPHSELLRDFSWPSKPRGDAIRRRAEPAQHGRRATTDLAVKQYHTRQRRGAIEAPHGRHQEHGHRDRADARMLDEPSAHAQRGASDAPEHGRYREQGHGHRDRADARMLEAPPAHAGQRGASDQGHDHWDRADAARMLEAPPAHARRGHGRRAAPSAEPHGAGLTSALGGGQYGRGSQSASRLPPSVIAPTVVKATSATLAALELGAGLIDDNNCLRTSASAVQLSPAWKKAQRPPVPVWLQEVSAEPWSPGKMMGDPIAEYRAPQPSEKPPAWRGEPPAARRPGARDETARARGGPASAPPAPVAQAARAGDARLGLTNPHDELPVKAGSATTTASEEVAQLECEACPHCKRAFAKDRLSRHMEVCRRSRAPPSLPARTGERRYGAAPTGGGAAVGAAAEAVGQVGHAAASEVPCRMSESRRPGWRAQHGQLQPAVGSPTPTTEPPDGAPAQTPAPHDGRVECVHCKRRFNEDVAERHIPHCGDVRARLRGPLKPTAEKSAAAAAVAGEKEAQEAAALQRARTLAVGAAAEPPPPAAYAFVPAAGPAQAQAGPAYIAAGA